MVSQFGPTVRARGFEVFARWIHLLDGRQGDRVNVALSVEFRQLGLTTAPILQVTCGSCLVLTDDLRLAHYHYMEDHCLPVLNFTHLRAPNLFG